MKYSDFAGIIFDVDDTLLDNDTGNEHGGLHARSRLEAFHEVGRRHNIPEMIDLGVERCRNGWRLSRVHSLEGAVWATLFDLGVVDSPEIDHANKLLREITEYKDEIHEAVLREYGLEVPGASAFVRSLAEHGFRERMAIASTAVRRDIMIFLEKTNLKQFFPDERIISKEMVTHLKPHPEVFDRAFASLGLPESDRARVLAFEDDPRGVASAKAAGLTVFVITTNHTSEGFGNGEAQPDFIADSFAAFREYLVLPDALLVSSSQE